MKSLSVILVLILAVAAVAFYTAAYVVDETEQVVVTRFGKVVSDPKTEPGLYFKVPFVDQTIYFNKNLLEWDGDPGQIPTLEKTYIWVDTFARWKIVDPVVFYQTVGTEDRGLLRLDEIIDPAVRNFVTSYALIEAVRNTNRPLDTLEGDSEQHSATYSIETGRDRLTQGILKQAQPKLTKFGIELVDVKVKRVNYVQQVRETVYKRMIAERNQIAEKFRSEGRGEAQKIRGDKERDLKQIESEAYRTAQEIKGRADAEATLLYAQAYGVDPEFYSFTKTLEIYSEALSKDSSLVLSTDSELLRYFKGYDMRTSQQAN